MADPDDLAALDLDLRAVQDVATAVEESVGLDNDRLVLSRHQHRATKKEPEQCESCSHVAQVQSVAAI